MENTAHLPRGKDIAGLIVFIVIVLAVSALGSAFTASSVGTWYQTLEKPAFNPPDWLFAPVWTALYVMMAVAAWRIWRLPKQEGRPRALLLFFAQLAANLVWSALFFGLRAPGLALAEIVLLLALIFLTMAAFWRLDRLAGALLAPYFLWVAFASVLNTAIVILN